MMDVDTGDNMENIDRNISKEIPVQKTILQYTQRFINYDEEFYILQILAILFTIT